MADPTARRRALLAAALVLALLGAGALAFALGRSGEQDAAAPPDPPAASAPSDGGAAESGAPAPDAPAPDAPPEGTGAAPPREAADPLPASRPERLRVPALDVDSPLEGLGQDAQHVMETPRDPAKAGWYTPGTTPGARGPAVVAGHVTWNGKPSVFYELGKLAKDAEIEVERADGRTAVFRVDRTERYPKKRFPTVEVYRNLDHAGLRLITCGGTFDAAKHYYADNVVVFATLTDVR
ncbi:class F sortase [Streptomyces sp. Z26]|uniref:class F sortase n=1 Tax=Streptomyces sp. Z26 TaxID=2500177 RepID=UPI000EF14D6A|nr:class F sortase [Streptomyces sp. Z26]RLL70104.1 class F sortase [Streptomyces sp. Z26]